MLTKLLSTSIIAGAFLVGCGGDTTVQDTQDVSMPHQVDMTPKNSREFDPEGEEYLNFMKTYNLNSRIYDVPSVGHYEGDIKLRDYAHRNQDLNYVFYLDRDNNKQTGYYNPWVSKAGADFLIEGGTLYEYTGTPGSREWSWRVHSWDKGDVQNEEGIQNIYRYGIFYGVALNQDWTQHSFLGYFDVSFPPMEEKKVLVNEQTNRAFTISKKDEDIYFHSYKKDNQKLDDNEVYYNYEFSINNTKYYIQGSKLFNQNWEVISDNLLHEVREYDTITIIPKNHLVNGDVTMNKVTIRDNDWNELYTNSAGEVENSIKDKILANIKDRGHPESSIIVSLQETQSNKIFVRWSQTKNDNDQPGPLELALYSKDGTNISFERDLILGTTNVYNINIEAYRRWPVFKINLTKINNVYSLYTGANGGIQSPYSYHILLDGNGNALIANFKKHAHVGNTYFTAGNNGYSGLSVVNTITTEISEIGFGDFVAPAGSIRSYQVEGDLLLVTYARQIGQHEYTDYKSVKYDISDVNDVKLISIENLV